MHSTDEIARKVSSIVAVNNFVALIETLDSLPADKRKEVLQYRNENGNTFLHEAGGHNAKECAELLIIKYKMGVNALNSYKRNCLHFAVAFGANVEAAEVFVKAGVNPTAKDALGQTPSDMAYSTSMKKLLIGAEARWKEMQTMRADAKAITFAIERQHGGLPMKRTPAIRQLHA